MPRIALLDLGPIGASMAWSEDPVMSDLDLVLLDSRTVRPVDVRRGSPFSESDMGHPRHRALAEALSRRFPDRKIEAFDGPDQDPDVFDRLGRTACDAVVTSFEVADPSRLWGLLRGISALGSHGLTVAAFGDFGWLVPSVAVGTGPCFGCAVARVRETTGTDPFDSPALPDPDLCDRLARTAVEELRRLIDGPGDLPSVGRLRYLGIGGVDVDHPLLRSPGCPECGGRGPFMPYRFARPLDLNEPPAIDSERGILDLASSLISPLTGPVTGVEPGERRSGDPDFELWRSFAAEPRALGSRVIQAGGCSRSVESAQASALGEAVERLAARSVRPQDAFTASFAELGDEAVNPREWDLFHPETRAEAGFPYPTLDEHRPIRWLWGQSIDEELRQTPTAVPVARVAAFRAPEDRHDAAVVSGFAAATCTVDAVWRGLREVLERDAFMIAWANRLPLRGLDLEDGPLDVVDLCRRFTEVGLEVRAGALKLDLGMWLVIAQCRSDRPGDPSTVVAVGCDPDLATAGSRALEELAAARLYVAGELAAHRGPLPQPVAEQVTTMVDHGLLYARSEMRRELERWWCPQEHLPWPSSSPALPRPSSSELLRQGVSRCRSAGLRVLAVDLTPPEMRSLGLRVVKTLVPGTYPMQFDSRWPHFGGRRLTEVPVKLGLLPKPLGFEELCRVPHPFP